MLLLLTSLSLFLLQARRQTGFAAAEEYLTHKPEIAEAVREMLYAEVRSGKVRKSLLCWGSSVRLVHYLLLSLSLAVS